MILVDSSVWIDHFRRDDPALRDILLRGQVLTHPKVVGELACGNLADREEVLALLDRLPHAEIATDKEVRQFIERRELMGRGIGYIDVHLLASVALSSPARLWTRDRRLEACASDLGLPVHLPAKG